MNLLYTFLNFSTPPVPPTPTYNANMPFSDPLYITNAFTLLNEQYLAAQTFINDLTAKLSALETAQANGTLDRCAAAMLNRQSASGAGYAETVMEHAALSYIATSGPLLLAAATALYLTPIQTCLASFNSTYQTVLHSHGLI